MRIRRGFAYVGAWIIATTAAVVLSWFGVRNVMHDAISQHAQPLTPRHAAPSPTPLGTGEPTTAPTTSSRSPSNTGQRKPSRTSNARPVTADHDSSAQRIRGYDLRGGRVVLARFPDHVELVSATPNPGFKVRTWRNEKWLRVDLISPGQRSSVIATWNGHPPVINVSEY